MGDIITMGNRLYLDEEKGLILMEFDNSTVTVFTGSICPKQVFEWLVRRVVDDKDTDMRSVRYVRHMIMFDEELVELVRKNQSRMGKFLDLVYRHRIDKAGIRTYFSSGGAR